MQPIVELHKLTKQYEHTVTALLNVDLSIPRGKIFGLLGPNGSGKTTMIKIIAGILGGFSGNVMIAGKEPSARRASAGIGYMPQAYALYEDLSVRENLDFFAAVNGLWGKRERAERISGLIGVLELSDKIDMPVHTLSGGMKQRVSLGCAMVHDPDLLLLDEPTVGLDPRLRKEFWGWFRERVERGKTIILSTHSFDEAKYCDTLGFLRQGSITAMGTAAEILSATGAADMEEAYIRLIPDEGKRR